MTRALLVIVIGVCALCVPARTMAQAAVSPDGWVVLPVDEYKALRERANPHLRSRSSSVDATLTRIDYDLRIENDAVAGRALLTIDVMRDGWTRVQIPAGLMVRDARLDGQPVSLVEGPPPHVLLSRTGRVVLTLDIALPLTASAGTESIALPGPPRRSHARSSPSREAESISPWPAASLPTAPSRLARAAGRHSAGRTSR